MNALYAEMLVQVEREIQLLDFPAKPANLYDPVRYIMSLGGKRVRPILTLLGCELYGTPYKNAINQAMAVELFHNFTLMHDDVMDSAATRRNVATVHKKWSSSIALLSGDGMMVLAYQKLFLAPENKVKMLGAVFSKTAIEVCEGQQLDMDYAEQNILELDKYLEMIRLKTAVLLTGSLQIGAIMAGVKQTETEALKDFAESVGLAFQLKDDCLDAFGSETFGKSIGGDIKEGKRTWLTLKCFELASESVRKELTALYQNPDLAFRVDAVKSLYVDLGIEKLAEQEVAVYSQRALDALDSIEGNPAAKETLSWLVNQLVGRTN
jgi:geranylgeranyl diphosphate synthase, type II